MTEPQASRTALGVAWMRAAHQILDSRPLILEDAPVIDLLGRNEVERMSEAAARMQTPAARALRAHVVVRSRFTEDRLQQAIARGVEQFVVLGAGYETFFARQPGWARALQVFEIDQPATQKDKLTRMDTAHITAPPNVVFGSVDLEAESLEQGMRRYGVRFNAPTVFSWLGVAMYLTDPAIDAVLKTVVGFPPGSEIVLTFANKDMDPSRPGADPHGSILAMKAAQSGEPWVTYYDPEELERKLRKIGFSAVEFLTHEVAAARYFAGRSDGLPAPRKTTIVSAAV